MIKGARVKVPRTASKGEVIRVRTKIPHPMETGWRKDHEGNTVPRDRITRFVCTFEGDEVFSADFASGVSANPYLSFFVRVSQSGTFQCTWIADGDKTVTESASIQVSEEAGV